jgi:hypothetical protein
LIPCLFFTTCSGQYGQKNAPKSNYKVNREYDKDGNLIHYDSTAISTWSYNNSAGHDTLTQEWENFPDYPFSINDSINQKDTSFYGFNFFDQPFNMQTFPDINDFFKDMYPSGNDFYEHIKEMEKKMDEMMRRNTQKFNQHGTHLYFEIPRQERNDTIVRPLKPKEMKNSGDKNIINI